MSAEIKHTPGPWAIVGKAGDGKRIFVESVSDDGWERCACEVDSDDCDSDMAMANARLIAIAPDLIDVLLQWQNAERTGDMAELDNATKRRDALIAKIEGSDQ